LLVSNAVSSTSSRSDRQSTITAPTAPMDAGPWALQSRPQWSPAPPPRASPVAAQHLIAHPELSSRDRIALCDRLAAWCRPDPISNGSGKTMAPQPAVRANSGRKKQSSPLSVRCQIAR
jgi:hypothetical protein